MGGNMFGFEIKKYLQNKMIIFIIIGMMLLKVLVSYFSLNISVPFSEVVYKRYLVTWDGELDENKGREIEEENSRLDYIIRNYSVLEEQYHNGEIGFKEFYECTKEHDKAKTEQDAFLPVYAKYQYYQNTDEYVEFFYDLEIIEFIELFRRDIIMALLLCFIISIVADMDYNKELAMVIKSQPEGRIRFEVTKILGVAYVSAIIAIIFIGLDFIMYGCRYSFENWDRTIHSIQAMANIPINAPVVAVVGILSVLKILAAVVMGEIVLLINKISKKMFLAIFISVLVLVVFSL